MTLSPLQQGVVPEGRYNQGGRSPIVWVWLCARCAGFAPTRDPEPIARAGERDRGTSAVRRSQCQGCKNIGLELHRFRAFIDSASGCDAGTLCAHRVPVVGDLSPVKVTEEMVERARIAGYRWFAEHEDGASADDEWRDHYRFVLEAALSPEGER